MALAAAALTAAPPSDRCRVDPLVSDVPVQGAAPTLDPKLVNAGGRAPRREPLVGRRQRDQERDPLRRTRRAARSGAVARRSVAGGPTGEVFADRREVPGRLDGGHSAPRPRTSSSRVRTGRPRVERRARPTPSSPSIAQRRARSTRGSRSPRTPGTLPVRDRLPQRARRRVRRRIATGNAPGAFVDPKLPEGLRAFRDPGPRRPHLRHLRGAGRATEDEWRAGARLRRHVRPRWELARTSSAAGPAERSWGIAWPRRFGRFGGDLLVGNFGDGQINAFEENRTASSGPRHAPGQVDGKSSTSTALGAQFGNGDTNGPPDHAVFTAGPDDESHGLFGMITSG